MTKKILVVEDDPAVRHMLTRVLSVEGYVVLSAADATSAFHVAAHEPLDLVVLGLDSEASNGSLLQRQLQWANSEVPMVVAGAKESMPVARNAVRLDKPWDVKTLLGTIRHLLSLSVASPLSSP
jgi:DNA-binding response OmpR family regulator